MLHYFSVSNFQSFFEESTISFEVPRSKAMKSRKWVRKSRADDVLIATATSLFGANGSGKTAILKALQFLEWFTKDSFSDLEPDELIPLNQHFASPTDAVSEFEILMEDSNGELWRYELSLTPKMVMHEALYRRSQRFRYVFIRDFDKSTSSYKVKQQGFGFPSREARHIRPNVSFLSAARQFGVDEARAVLPFDLISNLPSANSDLRDNLITRRLAEISDINQFGKNEKLREQIISEVRKWDVGIKDIRVEEIPNAGNVSARYRLLGVHETDEGIIGLIPFDEESGGTRAAFHLIRKLIYALEQGAVAVIDELDSELHPELALNLASMFDDSKLNAFGAQLIFSTHASILLDHFERFHAYFIEKVDNESIAVRGDDITGLRADDNLRAKYESGALGAVPQL